MTRFSDLVAQDWDYVVVGTGIGGATLGHALAAAGRRVLFLEKGTSSRRQPMTRGRTPEGTTPASGPLTEANRDDLRRAGRYFQRYADRTRGSAAPFFPFAGCGVGGSSALYGAILERLQPGDFTPRESHPGASESTIPREWPVSYAEMLPYYERAEAVYSVQPARLGQASQSLHAMLGSRGLHPYPLPTATRFADGCRNCQGLLCARECKIDSEQACLAPAIARHGAALIEDCEVVAVTADRHRAHDVRCVIDGQDVRIAAKVVVLAAGAMETPRLLLNSKSADWPGGLANGADLVGRNYMRHLIDLYVLNVDLGPPTWGKELGFADFYHTPEGKLGGVHGMGPMTVDATLAELERNPAMRYAGFIARPIVRAILRRFSSRFNLAAFLEDLPFADNRVFGGPMTTFAYRVHPYDAGRLAQFRQRLKQVLKPLKPTLLKQGEVNERVFHACGTCRFGQQPSDSVLDRNNRAHDLENLYVVDASFMPTSGGTAPSLTIAANAIRVADHLLGRPPASA